MRDSSNIESFLGIFSKGDLNLWFRSILLSIAGSAILFWIDPAIGLATFLLALLTLFLSTLITRAQMRRRGRDIAGYESALLRKFHVLLSSEMEARIYNYAKKIDDDLKEIDQNLQSAEKSSLFYSGINQGCIYLLLGINILFNLLLSIENFESGTLSITEFASLTILPLLIYNSFATLDNDNKKSVPRD